MLVASFFLQVFALVSPLFFQVVIDKVLVHRALSTLDVLVIGLLAISVFETILGILRTYLFAISGNALELQQRHEGFEPRISRSRAVGLSAHLRSPGLRGVQTCGCVNSGCWFDG